MANIINKKAKYRGFSFQQYMKNKQFVVTDTELIKLDLLNHIYTKMGTRVKMANFGTRIPELSFEVIDVITIDIIKEDITNVIRFDPRVELISMSTQPDYDANTLLVTVSIWYTDFKTGDDLIINLAFENGDSPA